MFYELLLLGTCHATLYKLRSFTSYLHKVMTILLFDFFRFLSLLCDIRRTSTGF